MTIPGPSRSAEPVTRAAREAGLILLASLRWPAQRHSEAVMPVTPPTAGDLARQRSEMGIGFKEVADIFLNAGVEMEIFDDYDRPGIGPAVRLRQLSEGGGRPKDGKGVSGSASGKGGGRY